MGVDKINTSTFIDFIKATWCRIVISIILSLIVILAILYVIGLHVLPAEMTSLCGVITYNSTGIAEILK